MTSDLNSQDELEQRLWSEIKKVRVGMLGLVEVEPAQHFRPMTAFCEPQVGELWFFARGDTELARAAAHGAHAMFVVQSKDQDLHACIGGRLQPHVDRDRLNRYWSPAVAAWYPGGKDDPQLTLLRLDAEDAEIWLSEKGPLTFAWEIAKANATHNPPDLGSHGTVDLR